MGIEGPPQVPPDATEENPEASKKENETSPEDLELMERWQSEVESMKIIYDAYDGLLKRYKSMLDFEGKPLPEADKNEIGQVRKELIQLQSDIKARQGEVYKDFQKTLMEKGLLTSSRAEEEWNKVRKAPL